MKETIKVIEESIQEKKEYVRRLRVEQDKLLEAITDNRANRLFTEKQISQLEIELKSIYDLEYSDPKKACGSDLKKADNSTIYMGTTPLIRNKTRIDYE